MIESLAREDRGGAARRMIPPTPDIVGAVALTAIAVVLAFFNVRAIAKAFPDYEVPSDVTLVAVTVLSVLPVAWIRVAPSAALLVMTVGSLAEGLVGSVPSLVGLAAVLLGLWGAGVYGQEGWRDWSRGIYALMIAVSTVAYLVSGSFGSGLSRRLTVAAAVGIAAVNIVFVAFGWWLGNRERQRREQQAELVSTNRRLVEALATIDAQGAYEARVALARDVHDIVGHSISLMGVQAAAARRLVDKDPERARDLLGQLEDVSRSGVGEVRSLIEFLRRPTATDGTPDELTDPRAPSPPTIAGIETLVSAARDAGATVDYQPIGDLSVSDSAAATAYRVVQEGLSNAMRHGDGPISVVLNQSTTGLDIMIGNDLRASTRSQRTSSGSGLRGMKERLALYDGTLEAGVVKDRWELAAHLPVEADERERVPS